MDYPSAYQLGPAQLTTSVQKLDSGRALVIEGTIGPDAAARIEKALAKAGTIDEIRLRSGGGDAAAGNAVGKLIRKSGVQVRIPAGWWCVSACNFVFFGGAVRDDRPGRRVRRAHGDRRQRRRISAPRGCLAAGGNGNRVLGEIAQREQDTAKLTADDIDVILRMGISRKLLSDVMYAQRADKFRDSTTGKDAKAETYRCLTRDELTKYNVVNTD